MENVKVDFTNKLGVISVVTMPVNQYVASVEALPKQYSLHIDADLTAEGAIDSAKILKSYIDSLVPSEEDQFETDEELIADLQSKLTAAQAEIVTLKAQVVELTPPPPEITA
jgi:hypothetical protein